LRSANSLTERHRLQIAAAAQWLCESDRAQFWAQVAREARPDANIERAIAKALDTFYRPVGILSLDRVDLTLW